MKDKGIEKERSRDNKVFYGWRIVAACFILLFWFGGAGFYSFSIFIKPFEENFGWGRSQIALAMSIFFLVNGAAQPLLGRLCQAVGPRKIILIGCLTSGISFILVSLTKTLWYFYVIYGLLSLTLSAISFVPISSLLLSWFERRRGSAIGLSYIGISAGGLILSPVIGAIITQFGLQYTFIILGSFMWVFALPTAIFIIKDKPAEMGLLPDGDPPIRPCIYDEPLNTEKIHRQIVEGGWPLGQALKSGKFWWISISFFLSSLSMMGVLQHQVPLISERGIPYTSATLALGMTSAIGGLGKYGLGRLTESMSFKWVMVICLGLQMIGLLLLLNLNNMTTLWAYAIFFGFGMGGIIVLQPLAISKYFGIASFGVLLGICQIAHSVGSSLGSFTSGFIYDHFGNYRQAIIVYLAVYLIGLTAIFLAGRPKRHEKNH